MNPHEDSTPGTVNHRVPVLFRNRLPATIGEIAVSGRSVLAVEPLIVPPSLLTILPWTIERYSRRMRGCSWSIAVENGEVREIGGNFGEAVASGAVRVNPGLSVHLT